LYYDRLLGTFKRESQSRAEGGRLRARSSECP
jgi:hypothetical protein